MTPDTDETGPAQVLREVRERAAAGESLEEISEDLRRRGVPTPAVRPGRSLWRAVDRAFRDRPDS